MASAKFSATTALATVMAAAFAGCGNDATAAFTGANPGHEAGAGGGAGGAHPERDAAHASTGGASVAAPVDGGSGCNADRGTGIPINSGTLSASVDSQTLSGSATILWAAGINSLTLKDSDGSSLAIVFPGCEKQSYSVPGVVTPGTSVSITYTGAAGGAQWACSSEDSNLGPATCMVNVTAYGMKRNAPVTGTFSGVLRLVAGTGATTKTVSAGTFTFGRP